MIALDRQTTTTAAATRLLLSAGLTPLETHYPGDWKCRRLCLRSDQSDCIAFVLERWLGAAYLESG